MRARDRPLAAFDVVPDVVAAARSRASSKPVGVLANERARSMPSGRRAAPSATPIRKARSPPVFTSNQSSAMAVPSSALRGNRRHPVPLQARLAIRIDDDHLRAARLRIVQVLRASRAGCSRRSSRTARSDPRPASRRSCTSPRRDRAWLSSRRSTPRGTGGPSCRRGWCRESAPLSAPRSRPRS